MLYLPLGGFVIYKNMDIREVLECTDDYRAEVVYRRILTVHGKECVEDMVDAFKLGIIFSREIERKGKIRLPHGYSMGGMKKSLRYSDREKQGISRFIGMNGYGKNGENGEWIFAAKFYAEYLEFCSSEMETPTSMMKLGSALKKSGYQNKRTQDGWMYLIFKKIVVETEKIAEQ